MKERHIQLYDMRFCLCEWGNPNHTPLLILHGWLDQAAGWNDVANILTQSNFYVLALDQRGHGRSDHISRNAYYHFPDYIADVAHLQQALQLPPFILLGHSMGSTIASQYAAVQADKVSQLVMIEGIGPLHEDPDKAFSRYKSHIVQRIAARQHRPFLSIDDGIRRFKKMHPYMSDTLAHWLVERMSSATENGYIWRWDPRHKDLSATGFNLERYLFLLSQIPTPTHVIFGNKSWYQQLPDLNKRIQTLANIKTNVSIPGGHSLHYETPKLLAKTIVQCLQESV